MDTIDLQRITRQQCESLGIKCEVTGAGPSTARIIVVAEAPGETEVRLGLPLVGGSGKFLWDQLAKIGIYRQQCYITNVIKRQVQQFIDQDVRHPVPKQELAHWQGVLHSELKHLHQAELIICLGGIACETLTGQTGIKKWRGSVFIEDAIENKPKRYTLITFNPAFVLREPANEVIFKSDIHKVKLIRDGKWVPYVIKSHINPTYRDAIDYLRKLESDKLPISFDIETVGNETACIGFTNNNHHGICIPFRRIDGHYYSRDEEVRLRVACARVLSRNKLVAQNGSFDSHWLWYKDRIRSAPVWFDTLLAHHALYPPLPHSLGFLTTQYTTHPYYKDDKDGWKEVGDIDRFWEYNVKDVCITHAVQQKLHEELRSAQMEEFFFNHVMKIQPHLVHMTVCGVKVDKPLKDALAQQMSLDVDVLLTDFKAKARVAAKDESIDANPNSPQQLSNLFFNVLKLAGRGSSTDEVNRARILSSPTTSIDSKDMLLALGRYKKEHKFFSVYANSKVDADDQFRCDWKQYGTQSAPGRLSSSGTLWGTGSNLQNQPERARNMFIAEDGYGFVYFDLAQAEARIVSEIWNVGRLKENFARSLVDSNFDVHRANAANIFQVEYDTIPTVDYLPDGSRSLRYIGKRCVHGLNYRMQADKLAEVCNIPLMQAVRAHRLYHHAFPEIQQGWNATVKQVMTTRMLWTPYGRRWTLLQRATDEVMDSIIAFIPQSTIGDKVNEVLWKSQADPLWPRDAMVALNIHDALIAKAPLNKMHLVGHILHKYATAPIMINGNPLTIPAELGFSVAGEDGVHRWSTIKKFKGAVNTLLNVAG